MHRIDTDNARPDLNGAGKTGFSDNTDISGQDATFLSPEWFNSVQEEIANVIEGTGVALSKPARNQLVTAINLMIHSYTDSQILALAADVQASIDNEASLRIAGDTAEAAARAGGDDYLQGQIDTLRARLDAIHIYSGTVAHVWTNGETGTYLLAAGQTCRVIMCGGGGGSGGYIDLSQVGADGGDSSVTIGSAVVAIAGKGGGGTGSATGGAYGAAGAAGVWSLNTTYFSAALSAFSGVNGEDGITGYTYMTGHNPAQCGLAARYIPAGTSGYGSATQVASFDGDDLPAGGGSAAAGEFMFVNNTGADITLSFAAGTAGASFAGSGNLNNAGGGYIALLV